MVLLSRRFSVQGSVGNYRPDHLSGGTYDRSLAEQNKMARRTLLVVAPTSDIHGSKLADGVQSSLPLCVGNFPIPFRGNLPHRHLFRHFVRTQKSYTLELNRARHHTDRLVDDQQPFGCAPFDVLFQ